ncbi:helix-turn-helix domain-containing protein [Methylobacterium sp. WL2]|nr:helix-turn-helix domain-containing protein [Methylobacterium sp. WL1]TXN59828.1 helix-turn-helix domain-containing protein [Methylobacterium sp. WL2]
MTISATNPRAVIRLNVAAAEIGLHPDTLRRMCKRGDGPRLLHLSTRCYGIRRADLEAWLETRDVPTPKV